MRISQTEISDVLILEPRIFEDSRGLFFESYNEAKFEEILSTKFVQDNHSASKKNVIRGLHFQKSPNSQGKLVRVVKGKAIDVIVDLRKSSKTFGKHIKIELSSENNKMVWVPEGMAHGFVSMEDETTFLYKCTSYYEPKSEECLRWDDTTINIDWGIINPIVSEKDQKGKKFDQLDFFN